MYIAFKWLFSLTVLMWLSMCGIDMLVQRNKEIKQEGLTQTMFAMTTNTTIPVKRKEEFLKERYSKYTSDKPHSVAYLHCFMFVAGALVVTLYNRKNEIVLYAKRKIADINTVGVLERLKEFSTRTTYQMCFVTIKHSYIIWVYIRNIMIRIRKKISVWLIRKGLQRPRINIMLLKKLQEIGEERKNLGQLLISAIHENKNIRMQYELENMAKNRLVRHIEDTQKFIKENRSRYVSFQQLYLVTHQENTFLKSRMKKLVKEKEEAEQNLMELMNEVYKSKNNELKSYCSRFIVRSKDNLLNSDVSAEIQKFLHKSQACRPNTTSSNIEVHSTHSWSRCANPQFAEIIQDDVLVPLVTDAPKLKGLPGECVWTVKDKDGLIEKLYEYDYESDFDNGDTIRRIRQYSVYYDKDCILDFSPSRTITGERLSPTSSGRQSPCTGMVYPRTSQGFLTGSEAFQRFMQNNKNVVSTLSLPEPP